MSGSNVLPGNRKAEGGLESDNKPEPQQCRELRRTHTGAGRQLSGKRAFSARLQPFAPNPPSTKTTMMSQEGFEAAPKRRSVRKTPKHVSLEEMIAAHPGKTPIQLLQEYGIKTGKPPMYDLEKAEGQAHLPSFTYKVTLGDVSGSGQGPSKKIARHKAAEAALKSLRGDSNISLSVPDPAIAEPPKQQQSQPNPIGTLQEMAVKKGWRLPEYSLAEESGPPHKREFTMTCRIEKFSETGRGTSKKIAKRIAAEKLLEKIKSAPEDPIRISQTHTMENSIHCTLESLKNSTGEKMSLLKRSPLNSPNCEYAKMLLEVSLEQKFDVKYLEIDELSVNGQYQCLAELSTSPVIICHGTGISCGNAHNCAAHNALQYLKILVMRK